MALDVSGIELESIVQPADPPQQIYILIHGTWASDADWCTAASPLVEALVTGESSVAVLKLKWSGKNSHRERLTAGHGLGLHLSETVRAYPGSRLYIIGHSHGGNVALYALRLSPNLQSKVHGLVFLSTPFFHAQARDFSWLKGDFIYTLSCFPSLLVCAWWIVFNPKLQIVAIWLVISIVISVVLVLAPAVLQLAKKEGLSPSLKLGWLADTLNLSHAIDTPFLVLRTTGDEASNLLNIAQFRAWATTILWKMALRPMVRLHDVLLRMDNRVRYGVWNYFNAVGRRIVGNRPTAAKTIGITLVVIFLSAIFAGPYLADYYLGPFDPLYVDIIPRLLPSILLLPAGLVVLLGIAVSALTLALMYAVSLPSGVGRAGWHILYQLSVEPVPPGRHTIHQVAIQQDMFSSPFGWNHSLPYQNPQIIELIKNWVRERDLPHSTSR